MDLKGQYEQVLSEVIASFPHSQLKKVSPLSQSLKQFFSYLCRQNIALDRVKGEHLEKFIFECYKIGRSPVTLRMHYYNIKNYFYEGVLGVGLFKVGQISEWLNCWEEKKIKKDRVLKKDENGVSSCYSDISFLKNEIEKFHPRS